MSDFEILSIELMIIGIIISVLLHFLNPDNTKK